MTHIARLDAFDRPLKVEVIEGEVVVSSDQAPVAISLTPGSARATGARLIAQADEADRWSSADRRSRASHAAKRSHGA